MDCAWFQLVAVNVSGLPDTVTDAVSELVAVMVTSPPTGGLVNFTW